MLGSGGCGSWSGDLGPRNKTTRQCEARSWECPCVCSTAAADFPPPRGGATVPMVIGEPEGTRVLIGEEYIVQQEHNGGRDRKKSARRAEGDSATRG